MRRSFRRFGASAVTAWFALAVLLSPAAVAAASPRLLGILNVAPVGVADSYTTPYQTRLDVDKPGVLANDIDLDSPTIYAKLISSTSHGVLELREEGRIRLAAGTAEFFERLGFDVLRDGDSGQAVHRSFPGSADSAARENEREGRIKTDVDSAHDGIGGG